MKEKMSEVEKITTANRIKGKLSVQLEGTIEYSKRNWRDRLF